MAGGGRRCWTPGVLSWAPAVCWARSSVQRRRPPPARRPESPRHRTSRPPRRRRPVPPPSSLSSRSLSRHARRGSGARGEGRDGPTTRQPSPGDAGGPRRVGPPALDTLREPSTPFAPTPTLSGVQRRWPRTPQTREYNPGRRSQSTEPEPQEPIPQIDFADRGCSPNSSSGEDRPGRGTTRAVRPPPGAALT